MLRGIIFYGATGGALTFYDPGQGAATTVIPVRGNKEGATIMGYTAFVGTPTKAEYVNLKIGADAPYHDIQLLAKADGDNLTADTAVDALYDAGNWETKESVPISGTAAVTGQTSGVIWYDDGEPTISWDSVPQGRRVFLLARGTGDSTTSFAVTNIDQTNNAKPLSIDSDYYVKAVNVQPEDALVQGIFMKVQDKIAVAPPKGHFEYPTCPLVFNGKEAYSIFAQVQAVCAVDSLWELIEVPTGGKPVTGTQTGRITGSIKNGGVQVGGSAGFSLFGRKIA